MACKPYKPDGPYVIQSGKRKGQAVENIMFIDYSWLRWMYDLLKSKSQGGNKNLFHLHLEWLLGRGETRESKIECPVCGKRKAKFFSVRYSGDDFSIGGQYICCEDESCISEIRGMGGEQIPTLYPFRFSVLRNFRRKIDQKRIIELFKKVFCLPERIDRKRAFQFFNE